MGIRKMYSDIMNPQCINKLSYRVIKQRLVLVNVVQPTVNISIDVNENCKKAILKGS